MPDTDADDFGPQSMSHEEALAIVKRHVAMLREHFDTVQIVVTRHESDEDGTSATSWGSGNWYARHGAMREALACQTAQFNAGSTESDDD